MLLVDLLLNILKSNTTHTAYRIREVSLDDFLGDTDCLENLGSLIRLDRRNSHLGSDLYDAMKNSVIIITDCCIIILVQHSVTDQLTDRLMCQIWIDRTCTVSEKCCKMMNLSRLCRLKND